MKSIYQWSVSLLVILCVGAIVLFLSPSSSSSKSVKTVVTLCVLMVFLSPVVQIDFSKFSGMTENGSYDNYGTGSEMNEQMLYYAELEAEELCESFVNEEGCHAEKIKAEANIDDNNCIYISKVTLTIDEKYKDKEESINERVKNVLHINGEFVWLKK